jgi:hypothetical protein
MKLQFHFEFFGLFNSIAPISWAREWLPAITTALPASSTAPTFPAAASADNSNNGASDITAPRMAVSSETPVLGRTGGACGLAGGSQTRSSDLLYISGVQ